jgi:hypothetical protein
MLVDTELKSICENIVHEDLNHSKWIEIESCDMYQTENYCGGFDATEDAFCFSYYNSEITEFWFQITLEEVRMIV